jgi:hypothetical protein
VTLVARNGQGRSRRRGRPGRHCQRQTDETLTPCFGSPR